MEKNIAENQKTSPDHPTLKSDEIQKKKIDFSSMKNEVEEKEQKEKNSGLVDESSGRVKSTPSLSTDGDSDSDFDSIDYLVSSDSSGYSYSDWAEWPPSTVEPISSNEPKIFKDTVEEETKPIEYKPFKIVGSGMYNLGNTCFLNSVVQSFMHTVVLLQLLTSINHVSPCETYMNGFCVVCIIREIIDLSMFYGSHFVTPEKLVNQLKNFSPYFGWNQQEDAHEFLQCFLNKLESCCTNLEPKDNIVKEAFGGRLVSKLRCCNCGHYSVTNEPLIDFSLEIEDVDSVPAALESFSRIENIEFFCERCKTQVPVEKQLLIDRTPSVAILHLKRFKNDGLVVHKVEKHVSFPLELDLLLYTEYNEVNNEETEYDLYAVIVHDGFSPSSGHYYCFIRYAPNEWYKFDDKEVFQVHEDLVLAEEAYIMFYAKRGTPWFSDFIQIHKPYVDLSIINTSFLSARDNVDAIPITSPGITNNHPSDAAADETSPKPELNKIEDNESKETLQTSSTPGPQICRYDSSAYQVYCEDQLQDVEIKQCSKDEELMDALHGGSRSESSMNDKKRKMEDSPSRNERSSSSSRRSSFGSAGLPPVMARSSSSK